MKAGIKGIDLIKLFEGCVLSAYQDAVKVWTIGYGHTGAVDGKTICKGMKISQTKADELLRGDLEKFEKKVSVYTRYKWTQNEFDALVSFCYNVGNIDQLTAGGTRSREVIAQKFLAYNKAGGKELAGLTRRRKAEQALFLTK